MSDHTKIPNDVKVKVWARDGMRCVVCGSGHAQPNSHVVRRSQGGLGIPENIVTHCMACHIAYDEYRTEVVKKTLDYIQTLYPGWTREDVTYSRWKK